jgi:hypothetical protein
MCKLVYSQQFLICDGLGKVYISKLLELFVATEEGGPTDLILIDRCYRTRNRCDRVEHCFLWQFLAFI